MKECLSLQIALIIKTWYRIIVDFILKFDSLQQREIFQKDIDSHTLYKKNKCYYLVYDYEIE